MSKEVATKSSDRSLDRIKREAKALRDNLRKRKQQQIARKEMQLQSSEKKNGE